MLKHRQSRLLPAAMASQPLSSASTLPLLSPKRRRSHKSGNPMGVDLVTWPDVFGLGGMMILSAIVSAGLIVILRPLLARYAMARPNARSSHKIPTPQGGGI